MADYRPKQRRVKAQVFTPIGWMSATFHVPRTVPLLDHVNQPDQFFTLTDVVMKRDGTRTPFLALHRSALVLLIPEGSDLDPQAQQPAKDLDVRQVRCLLEMATVEGTVELLKTLRVSDFFERQHDFVVVYNSHTRWVDPVTRMFAAELHPSVIVSRSRIIGVSEGPTL